MHKTRVIPVLLLRGKGLVKTIKFRDATYIGDPLNSVRIFNEKEVDELIFVDIVATTSGRGPDFEILEDIASEAFMPMAYGGGITSIEIAGRILSLGFEKIILNSITYTQPHLVEEIASRFGSQSVVASIDIHRTLFGRYELYSHSGKTRQRTTLAEHIKYLEQLGIGEIFINSIDRDGTFSGYDLKIIRDVAGLVGVPVIACGGAASLEDFSKAVQEGASAVAAGSLFVFVGPHRAVLINYPDRKDLSNYLP